MDIELYKGYQIKYNFRGEDNWGFGIKDPNGKFFYGALPIYGLEDAKIASHEVVDQHLGEHKIETHLAMIEGWVTASLLLEEVIANAKSIVEALAGLEHTRYNTFYFKSKSILLDVQTLKTALDSKQDEADSFLKTLADIED